MLSGKSIKKWLLVLAWATLIWILSGIPHLKTGLAADLFLRKLAHAFEFGILTVLLYNAWFKTSLPKTLTFAGLITITYAGLDELHQTFVAGRFGSAADLIIDLSGIFLAISLLASPQINKITYHKSPTRDHD